MSPAPATAPGPQSAAWLDEGDVNPEWVPPTGDPVHPSRVRRGLVYAGVLLSLVLLVGLVYVAGGFAKRTDLLQPVAPGELIVTGPYEFRFTEVTAQPKTSVDGNVMGWRVVALGTARNTGDETMAPTVFGSNSVFALKDPASGLIVEPYLADIGDTAGFTAVDRRHLAPGLPPIDYRVTFELPVDYQPGPVASLAVAELEYESPYLTSDEMTWDNGSYGFRLDLPVRVLPAES